MMKHVDLDHVYLGCTQRECKPNEILKEYREMFESQISAGATEKLPGEKPHAKTVAWSYDKEGHRIKRAIIQSLNSLLG